MSTIGCDFLAVRVSYWRSPINLTRGGVAKE